MSLPDLIAELLQGGVRVFDLGRPMFNGMPQSPNHPTFRMALHRRHGDHIRADGGSAAAELLVTGGHVGTHIDALAHVSQDGKLHGGADAADAQRGGFFKEHGIDTVAPMFCRGVLLDIPSEAAYEITPDDLRSAAEGVPINEGDVVLIRTGWSKHWDDPSAFFGLESGVPGPGEEGAKWLASLGVRAVGAETVALEHQAPGAGHAFLPAHRVLLVEHGIHIIEMMDLDELASARVREFLFVLAPLKLKGATGSPVRPLAIVAKT